MGAAIHIVISIRVQELDGEYEPTLNAPIHVKRRGGELKLVLQGAARQGSTPDANLVTAILDARRRFAEYTRTEDPLSISEIAAADGISAGDVSRSMQLAFLAPDLIEAILNGQQPIELTATRLKRIDALALLWEDQRRVLA